MGLMDRDYMHEPRRALPTKPVYRPMTSRIIWWSIGVCALIFIGTKYVLLPAGSMPFPMSGQTLWYVPQKSDQGAPLTISAPSRGAAYYAVRLHEAGSGRLVGLIPLRLGETVKVEVPLGQYEMTFASGTWWYGPDKLFGLTGELKKAIKVFHFYRTNNQIMGHTVDLSNRFDGNLPTRPLTPFDK